MRWKVEGNKGNIVLLLGPGRSSIFLYNYLKKHFSIQAAVIEEPVSRWQLIKRRAKKKGWFKVLGQVAFQLTIPKILKLASAKRYNELLERYELDDHPIDPGMVVKVSSVNDAEVSEKIRLWEPSLVVINGTRILSKKLLSSITCPILNIHAGITPKYRGVHGAYWALAHGDKDNCGVTVHLVDAGIDTGDVISQHIIVPDKNDNFYTYPIHQLGQALPWLVKAMHSVLDRSVITKKTEGQSKLWYHPTLFGYLYNWMRKGVR